MHKEDCKYLDQYPVTVYRSRERKPTCRVCQNYLAKYVNHCHIYLQYLQKSHACYDGYQNVLLENMLLLIMAALRSRCGHYIFALWFLSSSSSVFFLFLA